MEKIGMRNLPRVVRMRSAPGVTPPKTNHAEFDAVRAAVFCCQRRFKELTLISSRHFRFMSEVLRRKDMRKSAVGQFQSIPSSAAGRSPDKKRRILSDDKPGSSQ